MGIDLLDLAFRLEKRLQVPLRLEHFLLGQHTTVGETVELLWQRIHGLEVADNSEIQRQYQDLQTRILLNPARGWRYWLGGVSKDRRWDEIIPPDQRVPFWESLSRDLAQPLPPLIAGIGDEFPRFPEEIATPRKLLQLCRAQLFQRLKWVPIAQSGDPDTPHEVMTRVKTWEFSAMGRSRYVADPTPRRTEPWTSAELFDVVRTELVEAADVDIEVVVPDAELMDHLGML